MGTGLKRSTGIVAAVVFSLAVPILVTGCGPALGDPTQAKAAAPSAQPLAAPAGAQGAAQPSTHAASPVLDFEVSAPAGFRVDYSVGSRRYAETVDGSGHWKGKIDKIAPGVTNTFLTVTPPESPVAPYRASCDISYGGNALSHNESDEKRAAQHNVQCMSMINPR